MARLEWNEARDCWLRRLRTEGRNWQDIAAELGVTPDMAREHARRIGAPAPGYVPRAPVEDPGRPALPAGHARSWGLLVEGTVLAGCAWPGWDKMPPDSTAATASYPQGANQ